MTSQHRWLPNTDDFPTQMTSQHRNPVCPSLSLSFFLSHSFSCFVDKGPTQHLVRVTGSEFVRQHLARQRWWLPCLDVDSRVLECRGQKHSRVTQRSWQWVTWRLIFIGHFLQKSPRISGSFAENDLQFKASYGSSQPCTSFESKRQSCR